MARLTKAAVLESILNRDWPCAGFALGDLEPEWMPRCEWWRSAGTIALLFDGLTPRLMCPYGDASGFAPILASMKDERIWANVRPDFQETFERFYRPEKTVVMRRMYLEEPVARIGDTAGEAVALSAADGREIEELLQQGEWVLFLPHARASGHYYGVRENGRLVAIAGTHLSSARYNIAALGSVFTHPDHCGKGLGRICSSHVLESVGRTGIRRVVLNVEEQKAAARRIYERLGFRTACTYLDGECVRIQPAKTGCA
jgi:GNAT superfamily N-acetyltransferase